ncbi:hypothetical protein H6P81_002306 [Aristolochia fimbriata]|uniref:Uncharacterized protein n=1 Tax=Aristolochia fimbriata TaxID=158543 RepID=A0AAV7FA35_ARIFI|nr:hypothetical protein H6P81_002306 [Aristolochia fimbriata]
MPKKRKGPRRTPWGNLCAVNGSLYMCIWGVQHGSTRNWCKILLRLIYILRLPSSFTTKLVVPSVYGGGFLSLSLQSQLVFVFLNDLACGRDPFLNLLVARKHIGHGDREELD